MPLVRSRAVKACGTSFPYGVGSRAAAPRTPGFGLLGRNAAERAKKDSKNRALIARPLLRGAQNVCMIARHFPLFVPAQSLTKTNSRGQTQVRNLYDLEWL